MWLCHCQQYSLTLGFFSSPHFCGTSANQAMSELYRDHGGSGRVETGGCGLLGILFASIYSFQKKGLFLIPTAKNQSEKGAESGYELWIPGLLGSSAQSIQHELHGPPRETSF